jgi:hypothetical protein
MFVGEVYVREFVVQSGTDIHGIIGDIVEVEEVVHDYSVLGWYESCKRGVKRSGRWRSLYHPSKAYIQISLAMRVAGRPFTFQTDLPTLFSSQTSGEGVPF